MTVSQLAIINRDGYQAAPRLHSPLSLKNIKSLFLMITTEITIFLERLTGYKKGRTLPFSQYQILLISMESVHVKTQEKQMVTLQGDACLGHESPKDEKNAPMGVT